MANATSLQARRRARDDLFTRTLATRAPANFTADGVKDLQSEVRAEVDSKFAPRDKFGNCVHVQELSDDADDMEKLAHAQDKFNEEQDAKEADQVKADAELAARMHSQDVLGCERTQATV